MFNNSNKRRFSLFEGSVTYRFIWQSITFTSRVSLVKISSFQPGQKANHQRKIYNKFFITLWVNSITMSQKVNPTDAVREKLGEHPQLTSKAKLSYCHNWADNWSLGSIVIQTLMEDSLRLSPCRYQIFAEYVNREVMCLTHVNCRRWYPS